MCTVGEDNGRVVAEGDSLGVIDVAADDVPSTECRRLVRAVNHGQVVVLADAVHGRVLRRAVGIDVVVALRNRRPRRLHGHGEHTQEQRHGVVGHIVGHASERDIP